MDEKEKTALILEEMALRLRSQHLQIMTMRLLLEARGITREEFDRALGQVESGEDAMRHARLDAIEKTDARLSSLLGTMNSAESSSPPIPSVGRARETLPRSRRARRRK